MNTVNAAESVNDIAISPGGRAVAVGDAGTVVYSDDYSTWSAAYGDAGSDDFNAVVAKSDTNWIAGGATTMMCTVNGGDTWTSLAPPAVPVTDLCMSNTHVIWCVANGNIYRSIDGGATWNLEPNSDNACRTALLGLGTVEKIACCPENPNFVVGVGSKPRKANYLSVLIVRAY